MYNIWIHVRTYIALVKVKSKNSEILIVHVYVLHMYVCTYAIQQIILPVVSIILTGISAVGEICMRRPSVIGWTVTKNISESFSNTLSSIISISNKATVRPAKNVTLNGPEL